jgi:sulfatase modifying factor 1
MVGVTAVAFYSGCGGETVGNAAGASAAGATGGLPDASSGVTAVGGGLSAAGGRAVAIVGGSATGGAEGTGGTQSYAGCPGTGGPTMVRLPEGYCIDSTEVTQGQYGAWLATSPPPPDPSDPNCYWKTFFTPLLGGCLKGGPCPPDGCPVIPDDFPRGCADWCDAYYYCRAVGKRLCGRIGGGTNGYDDYLNPTLSQWYNACTSHGANTYPYGNTYNATACNGRDYWGPLSGQQLLPAGSLWSCQSSVVGYAGVFDLSGNVMEWEDSCDASGICHLRGGTRFSDVVSMTCDVDFQGLRLAKAGNTGFRCCSP